LLESEYAIIDGGLQGFGVDRYEFIVGRENRGRGLTREKVEKGKNDWDCQQNSGGSGNLGRPLMFDRKNFS
jgi:hypothetical protein